MKHSTALYVETRIRADIERVWHHTQDPARHQRWDLRFTRIEYLPRDTQTAQRFRYAAWGVHGTGITLGERRRADGSRTSALRFISRHPLSPIREGSGYWRYVPTPDGIRFLTGYDYTGGRLDVLVRPLLGWATAWSFDRLRLWLEHGLTPETTRNRALLELTLRAAAIAGAWWLTAPAATAITALAVLLPPSARCPAARRCLRTPPDRRGATAPSTLHTLEQP
ncbi:SRPBCC family protein [Pseudonocardiaceae bacterium YIM PH 21723]|nr:SRPBCC family protein [Pseudonocardiaceae bacterium YIM PH 21723]